MTNFWGHIENKLAVYAKRKCYSQRQQANEYVMSFLDGVDWFVRFLGNILLADMASYLRTDVDAIVEKIVARDEEISKWQRVCDRHASGKYTSGAT
jgi:hypothetical protein